MKTRFKMFRQFNLPEIRRYAGSRSRLDPHFARHFPGDHLPDRLVRALAQRRILPVKEVFESFELFERARKTVRGPQVADLCCGHGLTGMLWAAFERRVERVVLVDKVQPPSHEVVLSAVLAVAPWVEEKVCFQRRRLRSASGELGPGTDCVAVHACGHRTDQVLDLAIGVGGAIAVMPCCYSDRRCPAPGAVQRALGTELATDVHRTYLLEQAGYRVRWSEVPEEITPMRRVLLAARRAEGDVPVTTDGSSLCP